VSALDYDRTTLDARDLSYEGQLIELEARGWELDEAASAGQATTRYLRRHRRIGEIEGLFELSQQRLRLHREDDGTWTVAVLPRPLAEEPTEGPPETWPTALEAAEAAWQRFGGTSG
jgi:hypothetical protein